MKSSMAKKYCQKVINPCKFQNHLLKVFIPVACKFRGTTPGLLCFGLMSKYDSNKFKSLESCPYLGQILSGGKCYASTDLVSGHICMDHSGTKYAVPKSLHFCFFQVFFFMGFYPSSEIWSKIHFACVIRQAGFCRGNAWLHCRIEIRSPHLV